jgi:hypothetical protein
MRIFTLSSALALALAATPAMLSAQDSMWTAEQCAAMASWPDNQQADFKTWPMDYQMYYWTLTPTQQKGYWRLTNEQRAQIAALTPEQRTAAWASIESQMASMNRATPATPAGDGVPATPATPSPMASDNAMTTPSRMGNMTPPPAAAMNKTYPVCSRTITDSCQNAGEGGAPGRSRALKYWPGRPASEMRGRKPRG